MSKAKSHAVIPVSEVEPSTPLVTPDNSKISKAKQEVVAHEAANHKRVWDGIMGTDAPKAEPKE